MVQCYATLTTLHCIHVTTILILQGKELPLWGASFEGRVEVVETLLDRGAEVSLVTNVSTYYANCSCHDSSMAFEVILCLCS